MGFWKNTHTHAHAHTRSSSLDSFEILILGFLHHSLQFEENLFLAASWGRKGEKNKEGREEAEE